MNCSPLLVICLIVCIVHASIQDSSQSNALTTSLLADDSKPKQTDEERLLLLLMANYDPISRPVFNASHSAIVNLGLALIQIQKMDEVNQLLITYVWYEQAWTDERLRWNPSDYNGLRVFRIPGHKLWIPDIVLYNSALDDKDDSHQTRTMVDHTGGVFYAPFGKLSSTCRMDIACYPFDRQICKLKFGSWAYDGSQLDLMNKSDHVDLTNYIESGEWDLEEVRVIRSVIVYPCCPNEQYPDVTFYLHMRRRSLFYWTNIIFPCVWLTVINIATFALPPDSGERITLGITVFLSFSVFMLLVAENIPPTSDTRPLLGDYLGMAMSLNAASLICAIVLHNLHRASSFARERPPKCMTSVLYLIGPTVGLSLEACEARFAMGEGEAEAKAAAEVIAVKAGNDRNDRLSSLCSEAESPMTVEATNGIDELHQIGATTGWLETNNKRVHVKKQNSRNSKSLMSRVGCYFKSKRHVEKPTQAEIIREWRIISLILDRVLLYVFVFFSALLNLVFLFLMPHRSRCEDVQSP